MTRDIKFRVKTEDGWIFGSSAIKSQGGMCFAYHGGDTLSLKDFFSIVESNDLWEFVDEFINEIDKDGKEIWEGDICKTLNYMGVGFRNHLVINAGGRFVLNDSAMGLRGIERKRVEAIGNLRDNSELLE